MKISAYKSAKKEALYLFVPENTELTDLPDEMRVMFGKATHVIDFDLTPTKKLAREDAQTVLNTIERKGYYLQMPPNEVEKLSDMAPPPEKLDNIF